MLLQRELLHFGFVIETRRMTAECCRVYFRAFENVPSSCQSDEVDLFVTRLSTRSIPSVDFCSMPAE